MPALHAAPGSCVSSLAALKSIPASNCLRLFIMFEYRPQLRLVVAALSACQDSTNGVCTDQLARGHAGRQRREQQRADLSSIKPPPETLRVVVMPDGGHAIAFEVLWC